MIDQSSGPLPETPAAADAWINTLLLGMRLSGLHYRRIEMEPQNGVRFDNSAERAQFHFVARGEVVLRVNGDETHRLTAGDAVLLPRGGRHELLASPNAASQHLEDIRGVPICDGVTCVRACDERSAEPAPIRIFSGCMTLDLGGMQPLVSLMPRVMPVETLLATYPELPGMLEAMARESCLERAGSGAILARLADVVAASIIRGWIECASADRNGWLVALRDPRLGRVIAAMHNAPGRCWTLSDMAEIAGCSRSVFAARFSDVVGVPPAAYLTQLRMRLAQRRMAEQGDAIEAIAWDLGYASQAAFSRAFKRATGTTPAAWRLQRKEARLEAV